MSAPLCIAKELESIAGNAMSVRAVAAAWALAFTAVDLPAYNLVT